MNDQIREKEKSLTELMVKILKEPLKPLGELLQNLGGELSDIKAELELVSGTVEDRLEKSDDAAKRRSNEALGELRSLRDKQGEGMATLHDSLAKHAQAGAQALDARLSESRTALAQSELRVLDAVAGVGEDQRRATQTLAEHAQALDTRLSESLMTLAQSERRVLDAVASVDEAQRSTALALQNSLTIGQAGVIDALNQHAETLNARLDESQAKLRQLTIITGVFFISMLVYVGYDLLRRFS